MFKNIQNRLLLKYPLFWNTKFIPMLIIGLLFNLIYFFIGYYDGTIDFSGVEEYGNFAEIIFTFGYFINLIILVIWFWFYTNNNSFKAYYSKSKNALFYEFLQVFIIFALFANIVFSYQIGEETHQKSYFSFEEAKKRCQIITNADLFIDGNFAETEIDSVATGLIYKDAKKYDSVYDAKEYVNDSIIRKDYAVFKGKKYNEFSLINRKPDYFRLNETKEDSLYTIQLKTDLVNGNYKSLENLMQSYLDIVKEHQLNTNLTAKTWLKAVYYPETNFTDYQLIFPYTYHVYKQANKNYYLVDDNYYDDYEVAATADYEKATEPRKFIFNENYINDNGIKYSDYFVEHDLLQNKYKKISDAYTSKAIDFEGLLGLNCTVFCFALLLLSWRISAFKPWLLAGVVVGITAILFGIITAVTSAFLDGFLFLILSLLFLVINWFLFFKTLISKKPIRFSKIVLNIFIWSIPFIVPLCYFIAQSIYRFYYGYQPNYYFFKDNIVTMFTINFVFSFIALFFMFKLVRKYKGIPEE